MTTKLFIALAVICTACSGSANPAKELAANHAKWQSLSTDDYSIVFERRNFNGMGGWILDGAYFATVEKGVMAECRVEEGFEEFSVADPCDLIGTTPVEMLFEWAAGFAPAHTHVRFSEEWGIPISIRYDDPGSVDEETGIAVLDFEADSNSD